MMRSKKVDAGKLVVRFDVDARREYLTGFRKRKKLRKAKALVEKIKKEKEEKKKIRLEKRGELKKKLDKYGLNLEDNAEGSKNSLLHDHPNHVVVINMQPDFGISLSSMIDETEPSETAPPRTAGNEHHL